MNNFTKKQTKKNVIFAALQIIINGLLLFVFYKYLIKVIGVELIGVWSLVMAFSSFLRAGNFGFADSIVKFVSTSIAHNDLSKVVRIIKTSFTSVFIMLGLLLLFAYPILYKILPHFLSTQYIILALELLPYSLVSVWLAVLSLLVIFSFDGINRVDIRSGFLVISNIFLILLSILFVHFYGFIGLGYAQVLQSTIQLLTAWFLIKKQLNIQSATPFFWDKALFKEMFLYSFHLQIASFLAMMLEPMSKIFLGYFGSMSSVGYFDMANKLIMQVRNVVVNANQALVPMLSKAHAEHVNITKSYFTTFKVLLVFSVVFYISVALLINFISNIWIGHIEPIFINFSYIVLVSIAINTLAGAAYFTNISIGDVKYNMQSQMIIAGLNVLLGLVLGYFFKDYGVVAAYGVSIGIGSYWLMYDFYKRRAYD